MCLIRLNFHFHDQLPQRPLRRGHGGVRERVRYLIMFVCLFYLLYLFVCLRLSVCSFVASVLILKDPGRSKYNHTSMESLVDVEYKYIRVNIVFPFHKLQDAERTSHCPPPPSYVTYLVRLAETLMTSFRVGVARDVRPLELLWLARARRVNGFCTQSQ